MIGLRTHANNSKRALMCSLVQVGESTLEDVKYVCNITEHLARKVAKNVQPDMQLNDYLLYH